MAEQHPTRRDQAIEALMKTCGNVREAAAMLGIPLRTFYRRLNDWGLMAKGASAARAADAIVPQPDSVPVDTAGHVPAEEHDAVCHEVEEHQRFTLTTLRARTKLAPSEMSAETLLTMTPAGKRPRFLTRDRWHTLEQAAIDLSSILRKPVTIENLLTALVDTKLAVLMSEVMEAHETEKKGGKK